ncbi:hypothetical protein PILCRDRAFT_822533, partial [Piloderma croceum F 1598]
MLLAFDFSLCFPGLDLVDALTDDQHHCSSLDPTSLYRTSTHSIHIAHHVLHILEISERRTRPRRSTTLQEFPLPFLSPDV